MPDPVTPEHPETVHEQGYVAGARAARVAMMRHLFEQLGYESPASQATRWLLEREAAIAQLRILCGKVGDLEWDEQLHLGDIIDKHLAKHIGEQLSRADLEQRFRRVLAAHSCCECVLGDLLAIALGTTASRREGDRGRAARADRGRGEPMSRRMLEA